MRPWRWLAPALLAASAASAQDVGDGHLGDLTVSNPGTILNNHNLTLTEDVPNGSNQLPVGATQGFFPSDLLMLIRVRGGTSDGSESMTADTAGDVFFTRVSRVNAGSFEINPPADRDWPAFATEVVYVPEYRNLTLSAGASIYAPTYDGATGGVVVLFVTDELRVDGALNADGIGFRGGLAGVNGVASGTGCSDPNQPFPGGAQKGESLLPTAYAASLTGFRRIGNGGGGAVCQASGGGGGGNAGKGGQGGASTDGYRPVGGEGGAAVTTNAWRPLFGGGGGAGNRDASGGSSGGAGGGIVVIRAGHVSGSGTISARGADGPPGPAESSTSQGSPGGGGAGGTVDLLSLGAPTCNVSVKGGNGGAPSGGGGGGGRVRLSVPNADHCTVELLAGLGAMTGTKMALPSSSQAEGYLGSLLVQDVQSGMQKLPPKFEFHTLGCEAVGGGSAWLMVMGAALARVRRRRGGQERGRRPGSGPGPGAFAGTGTGTALDSRGAGDGSRVQGS